MKHNKLFQKWSLMIQRGDVGDFWVNKENFEKAVEEAVFNERKKIIKEVEKTFCIKPLPKRKK